MLFSPFPKYGNTDWCLFGAQQDTTIARGWQTWQKPVGTQWIYAFIAGGGAGGAGGGSVAAAARPGGGGGSGTSAACVMFPAFMVPDTLFVRAGMGGAGGGAATSGNAGVNSFICLTPSNAAAVIATGNGGNAGLASGGAGGVPGNSGVTNFGYYGIYLGSSQSLTGGAGGANTGALGSNVNAQAMFSGGAGGAGSGTGNNVFAGGFLQGLSPAVGSIISRNSNGGVAGVSGTTPGGRGEDGAGFGTLIREVMSRSNGMAFTGGAGGGSGGASNGGRGGNGGPGCGGGGGGAGAVGGAGGTGGDGFVIIGAF